jgi:outer membrane protein OmpA-like peptidoglycan-associated protein
MDSLTQTRAEKVVSENSNKTSSLNVEKQLQDYQRDLQKQNEKYLESVEKQREREYNNYLSLANSLRSDIRDLQNRINQRKYRNDVVPVYIPGKETTTIVQQPLRNDTVYVKDTLVLRDTLFIKDSISVQPKQLIVDTTVKEVTEKVDTVYISQEKIIKPTIDYSQQPPTIILFGLNKTSIEKVYNDRLNYVAEILLKDTTLKAQVSGHTDKTGSVRANEIVSLKRATAVKNYLESRGVPAGQILVFTYSNTRPIVDSNNRDANQQNRRVEIKLISGSQVR